jgi:hypothetical protein
MIPPGLLSVIRICCTSDRPDKTYYLSNSPPGARRVSGVRLFFENNNLISIYTQIYPDWGGAFDWIRG